ncbi:UNVERIFIED_CONTAM: hypothetical protein HDU68_003808 [Siphonaria sp. JEL0065]|nr:hypothetical protein HDU68_003808 [Siphonaria sp. JEL0065]
MLYKLSSKQRAEISKQVNINSGPIMFFEGPRTQKRSEHLFMISIAAGGASFPAPAYLAAISAFQKQYPRAPQVVYSTSNSGTGQTGVHSGIYQWGGSDIALNPAIISATPPSQASWLVALPAIGGGLLISYNVPGLQTLKLSRKVLPRIFDGTIRVWNHPLLVSDNPALGGVDQPIMVIRRSPGSGSTVNLVEGLKSMDISLGFTESPFLKDGATLSLNNSILVGTNNAAGTIVGNYPYTLTYMSQYEYIQEHMAESSSNCYVATLQHMNREFIDWNAKSLGAAMSAVNQQKLDELNVTSGSLYVLDSPTPGSYPLTIISNIVINLKNISVDYESTVWTARFLWWYLMNPNYTQAESYLSVFNTSIGTKTLEALKAIEFKGMRLHVTISGSRHRMHL